MTLKEIEDRIEHISANKDDDEAAHGAEDVLYSTFIEYVASPAARDDLTLADKARMVLSTKQIDFQRWCA